MKKIICIITFIFLNFICLSCNNSCGKQTFEPADFTYQMNGSNFKVLNFTDTQFDEIDDLNERKLLRLTIEHAVETENPDIITFTGDNAWGENVIECYVKLCEVMDSFNIPYFMVFGNHDREYATADELADLVNNSQYGHLLKGPDDLDSYGNYTIDIKNKRGRIVHRLIMMDTRMYYDKEVEYQHIEEPVFGCMYNSDFDGFYYGNHYDNVRDKQLDWYVEKVKDINIESTVLMHIPFIEYMYAYENYAKERYDNNTKALKKIAPIGKCRQMEPVSSPPCSFGFFDLIKKYNSTKNVIVGHDHNNDFSVKYQGVRLTFSLKTANECYWYDNTMTGYTVLNINNKGIATPQQVYYYAENSR